MTWAKRLARVLVLVLAFVGAWHLWPRAEERVDVFPLVDFTTGPEGVVGYPSSNPRTAKALEVGGLEGESQIAGGLLVLPPGASVDHPVPAVVILHGSGGDWSGRSIYLANRLANHGYAGFAVDTFVSRNLRPTDDYYVRLRKAGIYTQIADALFALKALQDHPAIDGDRVAVTGFSLGGAAALYSMFEQAIAGVLGEDGPRFAAFASFYAGCSFDFEDFRTSGGPVLLMMGEIDESMSVDRCAWLTERLAEQGIASELKVYEGAGHGWELHRPQAFEPGLSVTKDCLMRWTRDGENIEASTGRNVDTTLGAILAFSQCSTRDGYTMGRNEAAMEASWHDFSAFLDGVFRRGDPLAHDQRP